MRGLLKKDIRKSNLLRDSGQSQTQKADNLSAFWVIWKEQEVIRLIPVCDVRCQGLPP
jgi:hypothetical protein